MRTLSLLTIVLLFGLLTNQTQAQVCEANFSFTTDQLTVNVTNISTGSFSISVWDYGEGGFPGFEETHTYAMPGDYEVCLTITDVLAGCFDDYCQTITVTDYSCDPGFEYSFTSDNAFDFENTTVEDYDEVEWDFGDGNTSTFDSPTYTYNTPGTYEVCLTGFKDGSICGEVCRDVEVYPVGIATPSSSQLELTVFPNPGNGSVEVRIDGAQAQSYDVEILDITGRAVQQERLVLGSTATALQIDAEPGHYFIRATDAEGQVLLRQVTIQ